MHFKNRFKVYLRYTSLLNSWWTQSILEAYKSKLFFNYFHKGYKLCKSKYLQKYTSLLNSWWTQSILETYRSKLFSNYFHKVPNFASQNISKSILEVYFIFRVQKYIWSIARFQQDKILRKVYIIYRAMA